MRESWELLLEDPIIKNGVNKKTGQFVKGHKPHNKGQKMTEDKYLKCSFTMFKKGNISKRKYYPGNCKTSKPIEMLKNGVVVFGFASITDAAKKTGITRENIRAVCVGKRKRAGGYEWRIINDNPKNEELTKYKSLLEVNL